MSKIIFDKMTEVEEFENLEDLGMFIDDEEFEDDYPDDEMNANFEEEAGKEEFSDESMRTFLDEDNINTNNLTEEGLETNRRDSDRCKPHHKPDCGTNAIAVRKAYCLGKRDGIREGKVLGYKEGFLDGLRKGKMIGYKVGYAAGFRDGKCRGFEDGRLAGYARGLVDGRTQGFEAGKRVGFEKGFRAGFCAGLRAARRRRCGFYLPNPFRY